MNPHSSTVTRGGTRALLALVIALTAALGAGLVAAAASADTPTVPASISGAAPEGAQGQQYDFTYTLVGDPLPTTTYTGTLPPGLTLSAAGELTGVPTTAGSFDFTVVADNGATASLPQTVVIDAVVPAISGTPPVGQVWALYSFTFDTVGAPVVTLIDGTLPPGLLLTPDGTISGKPTRAGTFLFTLQADNGTPPAATDVVSMTIVPKPHIRIADAHVTEGNSGYVGMTFTVSLSTPGILPATVHWSTANGTAVAGTDYRSASGMITFPVGSTTQTITVQVRGDRLKEPNETFFVNLKNALHSDIVDRQATGVIVNDD